MADPTPDHIARSLIDSMQAQFPNWSDLTPGMPASLERQIEEEIRAAVAAEMERCAKACIDRWTSEPDLTRRNELSHGAIASAAAIRGEK